MDRDGVRLSWMSLVMETTQGRVVSGTKRSCGVIVYCSDVGQLLVLSQQQLVGVNCPLFIGLFIGVEEIITIVRLVSAGLDLCKLIYIQLNHWVM